MHFSTSCHKHPWYLILVILPGHVASQVLSLISSTCRCLNVANHRFFQFLFKNSSLTQSAQKQTIPQLYWLFAAGCYETSASWVGSFFFFFFSSLFSFGCVEYLISLPACWICSHNPVLPIISPHKFNSYSFSTASLWLYKMVNH